MIISTSLTGAERTASTTVFNGWPLVITRNYYGELHCAYHLQLAGYQVQRVGADCILCQYHDYSFCTGSVASFPTDNPGSVASVGYPDQSCWKAQRARKLESRDRGRVCDQSDRFSFAVMPLPAVTIVMFVIDRGSHKWLSAITRSSTEDRCQTKQYQEHPGKKERVAFAPRTAGTFLAVCILESVPRLGSILLRFKPRLRWIANTGEQQNCQHPNVESEKRSLRA